MDLVCNGEFMQLPLDKSGIYSVSLEKSYMMETSSRSITATVKGNEIFIHKEEFIAPGGAVSTLVTKYSTDNRFSVMLKDFSNYDFPVTEDSISAGEKDDYYTIVGPMSIYDNGYWTLDFKSEEKSIYIKGWIGHECYDKVLAILSEYFPQFARIDEKEQKTDS